MNRLFFIVVLVFTNIPLFSQIGLQSFLDKDSIMIGEQLSYSLVLNSASPIHSFVSDKHGFENAGIEVLAEMNDSAFQNDQHYYIQNFLLTVFDSGEYVIPSMEILVNTNKSLDTLYTGELLLQVYSPEVDTTKDIMDIKDVVKTPFKLAELVPFLPWIGGGLAAVVAILVLMWYLKKDKKEAERIEKIPAHIKALSKLDKIKETKLWQKGKVKDYYVELSDTIRTYIEDRYDIPAMESVTWEILESFRKYSYDDDFQIEILERLLNLSDLVKFAKENPDPSENETHLNQAYIFVEKTKVVEAFNPEKIQVETENKKQNS
ncbi:MAG: hypothetical protein K9H49_18840 [Bacteroidales bacterium]|nr:hypothetical protein [Bacteroidales bacterium]MCF8392099.1 hypothetical protein [Bacteroidales bacterium]